MQAIETVLFDFGGTLDSDGVAWKERFHALYRAEGLDLSAEAFAPVFLCRRRRAGRRACAHDRPEGDGHAAWPPISRPNWRAARRGRSGQGDGARGERVGSRFLADTSDAFARNRPVLEALAERYRLGIVSNFYGNLEAVCESAGLAPLFGVMTDSQRVGAEKPEPAIFHAALSALQRDAGDGRDGRRFPAPRRRGRAALWHGLRLDRARGRSGRRTPQRRGPARSRRRDRLPDLIDILT